MNRILDLMLLLLMVGCWGSSSLINRPPPPEHPRSSQHAAAVAEVLVSAENEGQAALLTAVCDLGHLDGSFDGHFMGLELRDKTVRNHCIGAFALAPETASAFLAETGGDTASAMEKVRRRCEEVPIQKPVSQYGNDLLKVTQRCNGGQMCTASVQYAFMHCFASGLKEVVPIETEKAFERMLATCLQLQAREPACRFNAESAMADLRGNVDKMLAEIKAH
jgi:hypothetical protein